MKTYNNIGRLLILAVLLSVCLGSCRNEIDKSVTETLNGDAFLDINVGGVNAKNTDSVSDLKSEQKASIRSQYVGISRGSRFRMVSLEGLDGRISAREEVSTDGRVISSSQKQSSTGLKAETVPMNQGRRYRILLYKDGTYVKSVDAVSGTLIKVEVEKDVKYHWYAYSFDSSDEMPALASTSEPSVESAFDKPLLYAWGHVQVSGDGVVVKPLKVYFEHRSCKVTAEINARGAFAGIGNISARLESPEYITRGRLNLLTGDYDTEFPTELGLLNFTSLNPSVKDTIKVASVYSTNLDDLTPITVKIESITLKLDKGDTRTFTNLQYSNDLDMDWGVSMVTSLDLVESPLKVGTTRWARANLYFSEADRAYRFRHQIDDSYGRSKEEYWNFKAPFPMGASGTQDPCTRVYPLNTWRMPNRNEINELIAITSPSLRTLTGNYVEYAASGTASPYPSNKLRINKMGYYNVLVEGIFGTLFADGIDGYFWSSGTGFLGSELSGVFGYIVSDNRQFPLVGEYVWENWTISSWLGAQNVRCVRNE